MFRFFGQQANSNRGECSRASSEVANDWAEKRNQQSKIKTAGLLCMSVVLHMLKPDKPTQNQPKTCINTCITHVAKANFIKVHTAQLKQNILAEMRWIRLVLFKEEAPSPK